MTTRTIYLVSTRNASFQRAHFAIFVPSLADPTRGSLINVVGAPMTGYQLEFERNYHYHCNNDQDDYHSEICPIGQVDSSNVVDSTTTTTPNQKQTKDSKPQGNLEIAASHVPAPGISENFMAPVNDVSPILFFPGLV